MPRLRISAPARADLLEIWLYIGRDSVENAERVHLRFLEEFRIIAAHPDIGRNRGELAPGVRSFPVGNYQIYYRHSGGRVIMLRVLHGARDVGRLLRGSP